MLGRTGKILFIIFLLTAVIVFFAWRLAKNVPAAETKEWGITFSKIQAEALNLDWQKAYLSLFDDLGFANVRIPVYWQEVELRKGEFNFSWLDFMVENAEKRNVKIILAVGRKLPRWPECHEPIWTNGKSQITNNQNLLNYIETIVKRYDKSSVVWAWQVENEPFLRFGECNHAEIKNNLDVEISLVRSLTSKPIVVTDGGEFGDWFRAYKRADVFGSTMYRHIYNRWTGEFTYPLPPFYFRLKRAFVEMFLARKPAIIIELQVEPWGEKSIEEMAVEEQYKLFGPERFGKMIEYAESSGFDTFYLWGAEWWYRLKEQGHPEMWEAVKGQISNLKKQNL